MPSRQTVVPDIVVVHGALGSASQMQPLVDALQAQASFASVTSVELPGHGDTPVAPNAPFDMTTLAQAIGAHNTRAAISKPIVFGYSMGGYAALWLEHLSPGTVGGIVTLGTMLQWTPAVARSAAARLDAQMMRSKVPAFADVLARRHTGCGGWEPMLQRTSSLLLGLGDNPPLSNDVLATIACPVHMLVGDRDDSVTLDDTVRATAQMPHGRASMLPDTPHPIEKVSLETITRAVTDLASMLSQGV